MSMILDAYSRLLIDVENSTGVHLDLPDDFSMNWVLLEGPRLDKVLLSFLEADNLGENLDFPSWLMPLWIRYLQSEDARCLQMLRTILVFGYKAETEPSALQISEACNRFRHVNEEVRDWNSGFNSEKPALLFREARRLVSLVIGRADLMNLAPCHGPGAVFPSRKPSMKGKFSNYPSITRYYPYDQYFNGLPSLGIEDLMSHEDPSCEQIACKMVAVPKDSRGPRLICVHPAESIWIQQGQRRVIENAILSNRLTKGRIAFKDQTVNGKLALSSSLDRRYCTIDLKEASDHIGTKLIQYLFGYYYELLACSRATSVIMLDQTRVDLNMFAPMGNCLTFPVESLVFWSLVRSGILLKYGEICTDVYVFGDDIICPTRYIEGALYGLTAAGLVVNHGKTFHKGFFRESCGVDAYKGSNITPFRCKCMTVNSYSTANSVCDLAKRLRLQGYAELSTYLYSYVHRANSYRLSLTNNKNAQGICEYVDYDIWDLMRYEPRLKFNRDLQRYEVPIITMRASLEDVPHHAWWHVQESLLSLQGSRPHPHSESECSEAIGSRSIEYPIPRGIRPKITRSEILVPSNLPWVFLK